MSPEHREVNRRLRILEHAKESGNVCLTCRYFGIGRATFYRWKKKYDENGEDGLVPGKPIGKRWPNQLSDEVVEKILHLRRKYHLGQQRIEWYLERYHGIQVSGSSIYRTLVRNGLRRLPRNVGRRKVHTKRYAKRVPGHHIQLDVKFLTFKGPEGKKTKRYQYTAIDDATRIRALKVYERHTQKNAIEMKLIEMSFCQLADEAQRGTIQGSANMNQADVRRVDEFVGCIGRVNSDGQLSLHEMIRYIQCGAPCIKNDPVTLGYQVCRFLGDGLLFFSVHAGALLEGWGESGSRVSDSASSIALQIPLVRERFKIRANGYVRNAESLAQFCNCCDSLSNHNLRDSMSSFVY